MENIPKQIQSFLELDSGLNIFMLITIRRWREFLQSTVITYNITQKLKDELLEVETYLEKMLTPPFITDAFIAETDETEIKELDNLIGKKV